VRRCTDSSALRRGRPLYYTASTPTTLSELWTAKADGTGARKLLASTTGVLRHGARRARKLEARNRPATDRRVALPPGRIRSLQNVPDDPLRATVPAGVRRRVLRHRTRETRFFRARAGRPARQLSRQYSYGEAFSNALRGNWHTREHEDLMAVDAAVANARDRSNAWRGGWSYGGINDRLGRRPHRAIQGCGAGALLGGLTSRASAPTTVRAVRLELGAPWEAEQRTANCRLVPTSRASRRRCS